MQVFIAIIGAAVATFLSFIAFIAVVSGMQMRKDRGIIAIVASTVIAGACVLCATWISAKISLYGFETVSNAAVLGFLLFFATMLTIGCFADRKSKCSAKQVVVSQ